MNLSNKQIRFLKAKAHHHKPVVTIGGKGISDNVHQELDRALEHHELIKVKLPAMAKSDRKQLVEAIGESCNAAPVALIGRIATIYRPANKPKIELPE